MKSRVWFNPEVFVGKWKTLIGEPYLGGELTIHFENGRFAVRENEEKLIEGLKVSEVTATLGRDDVSVSFWRRGYPKRRRQVLAMMNEPQSVGHRRPRLRFIGNEGNSYLVWACEYTGRVKNRERPTAFSPSFDPQSLLSKAWHVVVEYGDSGGRCHSWVRITRCPPRNHLFALSASEEKDGPWQLYDVLVYNRTVASLDSILHHRSLCYWPKNAARSTDAIFAMFDSRPLDGSPSNPDITLMPIEEKILSWTDDGGGAGVWGAEEGG